MAAPASPRRSAGILASRRAARPRAGVVEVKCLGLCPKRQVLAIAASEPGQWKLIEPGTDLDEVAAVLNLLPTSSRT